MHEYYNEEEEKDDDFYMGNISKYGKEPVDVFLSQDNISWPTSENQVFTVYFNVTLVLASVVGYVGTLSYRAKRLTAITFRFVSSYPGRAPSMQLFASGMGVEIGASEINSGKLYVHHVRESLHKLNLPTPPRNGRLFSQNKVSSGLHNYRLDLERFEAEHPLGVVKCNDAFPGSVIQVQPPGCKQPLCVSLFHTGKINIMGAYADKAKRCYMHISKILKQYRSKRNPRSTIQQENVALQKMLNLECPSIENLRRRVLEVIAEVNAEDEIESDLVEHQRVRDHMEKMDRLKDEDPETNWSIPLITHELIYNNAERGIYITSLHNLLLHGTKVNDPRNIDPDYHQDKDDDEDDESDDEDEDYEPDEEEKTKGESSIDVKKKPAPKRRLREPTKKKTVAVKRSRTQVNY